MHTSVNDLTTVMRRTREWQMRLTVREFVEGYKEGRDHSAEEVQAAIRKQVGVHGYGGVGVCGY